MKNKTKKALCAASILGVVAISGIFAYLTDMETKTNNFTVGNVDIELLEPAWEIVYDDPETQDVDEDNGRDENINGIPDFAENIVPGKVIEKDPQIENVGANDAYVFMRVTVPKAVVITIDEDGELENDGEATETDLFTYDSDDANWMLIGTRENGENDGESIYYYAYTAKLPAGETTDPLFESVQFANVVDGQLTADEETDVIAEDIKIDAFAIQCDAIPNEDDIDPTILADMTRVFNLISSQNDLGVHLEDSLK